MTASAVDDKDSDLQALKESALFYIDQNSQLALVKERCEEYVHNKEVCCWMWFFKILSWQRKYFSNGGESYQILIRRAAVSITELVTCGDIGDWRIQSKVCLTAIQSLSLLPGDIKSSQVIVNLRIAQLPPFTSYHIHPLDIVACKFESRLYQFNGVVISMTTPSEYSQVAKYRCPVSDCVGATDNQYIRLHTAGAKETHTIRRDFHCVYCGSTLVEDVNCRILGEKVVVEIIEQSCLSTIGQSCEAKYNQSMTVFLRDDLIQNVHIGGNYTVIGIPVKQMMSSAKVFVSFEANNIYQTKTHLSLPVQEIPSSIADLYKDRVSSPWSFSASLAYLFGSNIAPPGTFHKLKLIMLLSLVDSMSKTQDTGVSAGRLHLFVTGKDTVVISRLLAYGASFADRSIQHSAGFPLLATVNKDEHGTGACSIDGGSLLLAHDGICQLGDVAKFKKDVIEKLYHVMESRKLTVEIPKKYSNQAQAMQRLVMPVKCTVWAYGDKAANKTSLDVFAPLEPNKSSTSLLEECFALTVPCSSNDCAKDEYAEQCLLYQTLRQAISTDGDEFQDTECLLEKDDLKQFLSHISHINVKLSEAATRLIKGYFVASRRVRSSGVHGTPFPQAALQTLSELSKAHARLNMRQEASEQDAVLAIMIYEELVTVRLGYSVLSVQPRPHFRDDNIDAYIGPENDIFMHQFHMQLVRFCSSHAPDFEVFESES